MRRIVLVTGGARSGKSEYAEKIAHEAGGKVLYIATAIPFDEEMKSRVKKHRDVRPDTWDTYEGYKSLDEVVTRNSKQYETILIDCVTIMVTNLLFDYLGMDNQNPSFSDFEEAERKIKGDIEKLSNSLKQCDTTVILVTNELGSGIVPESLFGRAFRDIAGRMNKLLAENADEVYLCVCGIPVKIK